MMNVNTFTTDNGRIYSIKDLNMSMKVVDEVQFFYDEKNESIGSMTINEMMFANAFVIFCIDNDLSLSRESNCTEEVFAQFIEHCKSIKFLDTGYRYFGTQKFIELSQERIDTLCSWYTKNFDRFKYLVINGDRHTSALLIENQQSIEFDGEDMLRYESSWVHLTK